MWLILLRRFWPYLAALVALGALWAWHASKVHQADRAGYARAVEERRQADEKATKAHNDRIEELNRAHSQDLAALALERDRLLSNPVVRTIRVRLPAGQCTAPVDAGLSRQDPGPVDVLVPDPGFGELRRWLLYYGAAPDHGGRGDAAVPAPSP
jgi:hypothetical protein